MCSPMLGLLLVLGLSFDAKVATKKVLSTVQLGVVRCCDYIGGCSTEANPTFSLSLSLSLPPSLSCTQKFVITARLLSCFCPQLTPCLLPTHREQTKIRQTSPGTCSMPQSDRPTLFCTGLYIPAWISESPHSWQKP